MAVMPTMLYYLSIFLMVEFDAKKFGAQTGGHRRDSTAWDS